MGRQPVDQGWAWLICLGTGVQAFFVIGGLKSMGVLFAHIVTMFDAPSSVTALTLGCLAGGFALFAMMTNVLTVMFGIRPIIMLGGVLFTTSIFMSAFPVNVWYLIVTMGLIMGIALATMYTPSVLLLNHYFDKRRSFANGLSFVGSSFGQLCLPYMITYLVEEYGYRGAMLIYTAISMHSFAAALLMRPVSFWGKNRKKAPTVSTAVVTTNARNNTTIKIDGNAPVVPNGDHVSAEPEPASNDSPPNLRSADFTNMALLSDKIPPSHHRSHPNVVITVTDSERDITKYSYYRSHPAINTFDMDHKPSAIPSHMTPLTLKPGLSVESLAVITSDEGHDEATDAETSGRRILCLRYRRITCVQFINLMFDPDLVKSPSLWIIFMSLGLGHAGFINSLLHIPVLTVELFNDKYKGAMLIAIAGVFDIAGRLGGGWFADLGYMRRSNISATAFAITGCSTVIAMLYPVLPMLIAYSVIMGLIGGIYRILLPVIVGDVFGKAKLGPGIGMLFMALGILAVPIPSILGAMHSAFSSYLPAFHLCGALLIFGAVLLYILPLLRNCDAAVVKETPLKLEKEVEL